MRIPLGFFLQNLLLPPPPSLMQTTLPFVVISIFLTAFKILLTRALGATLSFYAASGSKYGNSIRWYRHGGYLEMTRVFRSSFGHVPRSTTVAMTLAIIASVLAHFSSVYLSTMAPRSDIEVNPSHIGIKTMRLMPSGSRNDQWTTYLTYGSKIEDALVSMINDTRNLADVVPGRRYTPRTFDYEPACDSIEVAVFRNLTKSDILLQEVGGCSAVFLRAANPYFDWDPATATNVRTASDQYTIVASAKYPEENVLVELRVPLIFHYQYRCLVTSSMSAETISRSFKKFPNSGMTSLPRTALTKCQYPSGALNVVSQTQMSFAVQRLSEYDHISTTIFDDSTQLPLLATMSAFTKNGTFSIPRSNSTLVALTKAGTNVHFLMCHSLRHAASTDIGLLCSYSVIDAVMTTPQAEDPVIAADLIGRWPVPANESVNQNAVWVGHLPMNLTSDVPTFSASSILDATLSGAQYLASLGQNFVTDWETGQLYVLFDTVDIKDGYEFSTGLFATLVAIMVLCACVWAYTEKSLKAIYTVSLYRLEYTKREPYMEKPVSMVMNCTYNPLAFEGVPIVGEHDGPVDTDLQELMSGSDVRLTSPASLYDRDFPK
ncbi:hypothetical protein EC968_008328 [Mortierella alpina]|nr:hypothetical protein EC968_008328 [Mortierella alpina]